jgi:hypothetical protein
MQWTVRLETRTSQGEVTTAELVTFSRPMINGTLADVGLMLSEMKALSAKLQTSMLCDQLAEYGLPVVMEKFPTLSPTSHLVIL